MNFSVEDGISFPHDGIFVHPHGIINKQKGHKIDIDPQDFTVFSQP